LALKESIPSACLPTRAGQPSFGSPHLGVCLLILCEALVGDWLRLPSKCFHLHAGPLRALNHVLSPPGENHFPALPLARNLCLIALSNLQSLVKSPLPLNTNFVSVQYAFSAPKITSCLLRLAAVDHNRSFRINMPSRHRHPELTYKRTSFYCHRLTMSLRIG